MPEDKVKVVCNKDQRWSFGTFKKDQVIEVSVDIGKTFVESGYGDYFVKDGEKKKIDSPAVENKMLDPAEEDKSEDEEQSESVEDEDPAETIDFKKFTKKNDLESYAKEAYGIDLDKRKTVKGMIEELEEFLEENNKEGDE